MRWDMNKKTVKRKPVAYEIVVCAILTLYSLILVGLFLWAFLSSFRTHANFRENPLAVFSEFEVKNYQYVLNSLKTSFYEGKAKVTVGLITMFTNSLIYSGGGALIQTLFTAAVAYCCARYKCLTSTILRNVVIVTMILPVVGTMPSLLEVLKTLSLHNTWIGIFAQRISFCSAYFLIFYAAFSAISWEYAESAFIDGASHFLVFIRIMLPLVTSLLVTVFILLFVQFWNDYQTPWLLIPSYPTAALGLYHYLNDMQINNVPAQIASGMIIFVPVFTIFVIFRDRIMGNLTEGGIKG